MQDIHKVHDGMKVQREGSKLYAHHDQMGSRFLSQSQNSDLGLFNVVGVRWNEAYDSVITVTQPRGLAKPTLSRSM